MIIWGCDWAHVFAFNNISLPELVSIVVAIFAIFAIFVLARLGKYIRFWICLFLVMIGWYVVYLVQNDSKGVATNYGADFITSFVAGIVSAVVLLSAESATNLFKSFLFALNYRWSLHSVKEIPRAISSGKLSPGDRGKLKIKGNTYSFCWIPKGSFSMGADKSEIENSQVANKTQYEKSPRKVHIGYDFWILETQVTQRFWKSIMGDNPSAFSRENKVSIYHERVKWELTDEFPVDSVSWYDCDRFVKKLNGQDEDGNPKWASMAPSGWRFSLPTEAEWEYTCRAGTDTPFSFGYSLNGIQANCDGFRPYEKGKNHYNVRKGVFRYRPTMVRTFKKNDWGLYDMHGNVWEWCLDEDYKPERGGNGEVRCIRGGAWDSKPVNCRSASSHYDPPEWGNHSFGLRLVLVRKDDCPKRTWKRRFVPISDKSPGVCISYLPVTNEEYIRFAKATGRTISQRGLSATDPVVGVTFEDAVDYCKWLSSNDTFAEYSLPTVKNWEDAAGQLPEGVFFNNNNNNNNKGSVPVDEYTSSLIASGFFNKWGNIRQWTSSDSAAKFPGKKAVKKFSSTRHHQGKKSKPSSANHSTEYCDPYSGYNDVGFRVIRKKKR